MNLHRALHGSSYSFRVNVLLRYECLWTIFYKAVPRMLGQRKFIMQEVSSTLCFLIKAKKSQKFIPWHRL